MRNPALQHNWLGSVDVFPKGAGAFLSQNFVSSEFDDPSNDASNHFTLISYKLPATLQAIRDRIGKPIIVQSGFRTAAHNAQVGGATQSYHTIGMAADIICIGVTLTHLYSVINELYHNGKLPLLGGLGFYSNRNHIHVDVRPKIDNQLVVWTDNG